MNSNEYMTISAFAKAVGTTNQAIYQQLDKRLKPYYKVIDNKKMLSVKAIKEIYNKSVDKDNQVNLSNDSKEEINFLRKQVETLTEDLKVEREHNRELQDKLMVTLNNLAATPMLEQQNQLADKIQQGQAPLEQPKGFIARLKFAFKGE